MRPKDGLDGYSGDKSELDYAISHDEWWGGQEETGTRVDVEPGTLEVPLTLLTGWMPLTTTCHRCNWEIQENYDKPIQLYYTIYPIRLQIMLQIYYYKRTSHFQCLSLNLGG